MQKNDGNCLETTKQNNKNKEMKIENEETHRFDPGFAHGSIKAIIMIQYEPTLHTLKLFNKTTPKVQICDIRRHKA